MIKIQRLNLDNSWYLHMGGIKLLIDPWLEGEEVDYFSWFNTQWHRHEPLPYQALPEFDAVLITQKYPDHYHKQTLLKLKPKRVIAPASIRNSIEKLLPETSVLVLSKINPSFYLSGVKFSFLSTSRKIDPIYDAMVLEDDNHSVFLATHGFHPTTEQKKQMKTFLPCKVLITPFNEYKLPAVLGGTVSPGLDNVKLLVDLLNPEHVFHTHDEDKHAKGLVSKFAKIKRPESTKELLNLPWLKNRYSALDNYNLKTIS